jgi:hypothetical protein
MHQRKNLLIKYMRVKPLNHQEHSQMMQIMIQDLAAKIAKRLGLYS